MCITNEDLVLKPINVLFDFLHEETGISREVLTGIGRQQEVVDARELFVRICRNVHKFSYPRIGRALKRDHTTAMHLYKRNRVSDKEYRLVVRGYVDNCV